jgi:HPt (histidine-containing phosphotransfer) domain-containing protein
VAGKPSVKGLAPPKESETASQEMDFDRKTALEMLGGREDLLARMDEIFLRDVPIEMKELTNYVASREWENARRLAHSIKGSSRTVGAQRAGAIAEQMEFLCKQKDAPSAKRELKTLESEVKFALEYIMDVLPKK